MALTINDIKHFKSKVVSDTSNNGGIIDETKTIVSNVKYNLFPRVSYLERINGIVRFRKEFIANRNMDNEIGYNCLAAIIKPSNGDDVFYIKPASYTDTQRDLEDEKWRGCGRLFEDVEAGSKTIKLICEDNDLYFENSGVLIVGKYNPTAQNQEELFVDVSYCRTENLEITLNVVQNTSLICSYYPLEHDKKNFKRGTIIITYTIDEVEYQAHDDGEGNIIGDHIVSGTVDYNNGINVEFDSQITGSMNLRYIRTCDIWNGNVATIRLEDPLFYDYSASDEIYGGMAVSLGDLKTEIIDVNIISTSGSFDETLVELFNVGTIYDEWTLTFQSPTIFTCEGAISGSLQNGSILSLYNPLNPVTQTPLFKIFPSVWGGAWDTGDRVTFKTLPAYKGLWWKEKVPAGSNREPNNLTVLRVTIE